MIRIRLSNTTEATLVARRWRSDDPRLERLLNAMLSPWGPYGSEAEAEQLEARVASQVLGAEIIEQYPDAGLTSFRDDDSSELAA